MQIKMLTVSTRVGRRGLILLLFTSMILGACNSRSVQTSNFLPSQPDEQDTSVAASVTENQPGDPTQIPECLRDTMGCAVIPPGETVKLGMGGPMTGDLQTFGLDIYEAGVLAIADVGHYLGWDFELVQGDTQGSPAVAATIASEWVRDPTLVAIAGHIFSGETSEVMPIYEQAGIPMMSPSATNPDLTNSGSPVFNRLAFTDVVQATTAAEYLFGSLGLRSIAVLHDGEPYGEGLAIIVADLFEELSGQVVALESIDPVQGDLATTLQGVIENGEPQAIYYGGYDDVGIAVVNELARLRTGAGEAEASNPDEEPLLDERYDVIFFGCDGTFGTNFRTQTGENGEGAYAASLTPPDTEVRAAFDIAFISAYGRPPGQQTPYTWHGYDAVGSLIFAVKSVALVGEDGYLYVPRGQLTEVVRGLKDYPGVSGEVTCNALGECSTNRPQFYILQNGDWVLAP